ncbi:MAG: ORF6N domain-containing protein, partial [Bacteroidetes bacterium]
DNYIDDTVLTHFAKRQKDVNCIILTKNITKQLQLDVKKHNEQYQAIKIEVFSDAHDRFLIIDKKEIYHFGASLKDLGNKWFAFSKMDISSVKILDKLKDKEVI